jgi:hypothetical protein
MTVSAGTTTWWPASRERALVESLFAQQSDAQFDAKLDTALQRLSKGTASSLLVKRLREAFVESKLKDFKPQAPRDLQVVRVLR